MPCIGIFRGNDKDVRLLITHWNMEC